MVLGNVKQILKTDRKTEKQTDKRQTQGDQEYSLEPSFKWAQI